MNETRLMGATRPALGRRTLLKLAAAGAVAVTAADLPAARLAAQTPGASPVASPGAPPAPVGETLTLGRVIAVGPTTLVIGGQPLDLAHGQPDICNCILHRAGDTLYLIDTGSTAAFRPLLLDAARSLGPVTRAVLINTHGHPDHTGNNDLLAELGAAHTEHYLSAHDVALMRGGITFFTDFLQYAATYMPLPAPPAQFAAQTWQLFQPYRPSVETVIPLERRPIDAITLGGVGWTGWRFGDDVSVLRTYGHTPGEIIVYLPAAKLLHTGDETVAFFPAWPVSDPVKIYDVFARIVTMHAHGAIEFLTDGHNERVFRGAAVAALPQGLIASWVRLDHALHRILAAAPTGLPLTELVTQLRADDDAGPDLEGVPLFTNMVVLMKLRELGARQSDAGSLTTRFMLP